jgi:hypothetical protein
MDLLDVSSDSATALTVWVTKVNQGSSSASTHGKTQLGLGLGLGISLYLLAVIAGVILWRRRRKQTTGAKAVQPEPPPYSVGSPLYSSSPLHSNNPIVPGSPTGEAKIPAEGRNHPIQSSHGDSARTYNFR